jgi:type IV secretion system protein VirB9
MRLAAAAVLAILATGASAQVAPSPGFDDPRLQTVAFDPSRPVRLVAFPDASLTVVLLPGEQVQRIAVSDPLAFDAKATGANDSVSVRPLHAGGTATMLVDTAQRRYEFELATGDGLAAAYVVRFVGGPGLAAAPQAPAQPAAEATQVAQAAATGAYRLSGERTLMPSRIADDGTRTYLEWDTYQSLPAVFGIGYNGKEEVVDGYMRGGVFTIDRVYGELIFRIDDKRARARRVAKVGAG